MAFGTGSFRRGSVPPAIDTRLLDRLPSAVLLCDPQTFVIRYANGRALALFERLSPILPVQPEMLVGSPLDLLHPAFAERREQIIGSDDAPLRLQLHLKGETLEFHLDGVRDARGRRSYLQVTWNITSELVAEERKVLCLRQMVDDMPVNIMTCDPRDFRIDYVNRATLDTLRRIEGHLPIRADALIGTSIDVFHKDPARWRALLSDPTNLPHTARIRVGTESLDLRITAIMNADGSYAGPMVTWSLATGHVQAADAMTRVVGDMTVTAEAVEASSAQLLDLTHATEQTASAVSTSTLQVSNAFDEISDRLREALTMSGETATKAEATDDIVNSLANSVKRIGAVTDLIEKIASQTNLLALNATIEAARVGSAGKGFEVVAQEVKALAVQTAEATKDIRGQVGAVQQTSSAATGAVFEITQSVGRLTSVFKSITAGMTAQAQANRGVSESMEHVARAASEIRAAASEVSGVAGGVADLADTLKGEVRTLLSDKGRDK
ncbi:MAG: methyl-accepting chemotaxis protein [Pseudomonadota bacterium]